MDRKLRFRGESRNKVDGKGRVSIPANFRRVLEAGDPDWDGDKGNQPHVVIVYGLRPAKYLECYTVKGAEAIEDRIETLKSSDPLRKKLVHIYSTQALTSSLDDTGRIVLPARLRDTYKLQTEAYFASRLDKFQIWNPEAYAADVGIPFESEESDEYEDFDAEAALDAIEF